LTPGHLITHLRKLEDAGYVTTKRTAAASPHEPRSRSPGGRAALESCTAVLRQLVDSASLS
jgi:DNA-binding MarR family transcriptional regulator